MTKVKASIIKKAFDIELDPRSVLTRITKIIVIILLLSKNAAYLIAPSVILTSFNSSSITQEALIFKAVTTK